MDNGLKVRQILFEGLLADGDNRENWEKLCCSNRPLVPFFGAGISAWCYPTWNNLLKDIVEKCILRNVRKTCRRQKSRKYL